tara:strand:- start:1936 stop:2268 length:333 start_codon:yes stop_codon:yes gene_type:complete
MKPTLTIAPKPKSFKQDSIDLLLATQSELNALKLRVDEARINPITDRELETAIALTGLKVIKFEQRLEMYIYHHEQTQDYLDMQNALDDFKLEHEELMEEFHDWLEDVKV